MKTVLRVLRMDDVSKGKVMIITVQHDFTKNTFDTFRLFKKEIEKQTSFLLLSSQKEVN